MAGTPDVTSDFDTKTELDFRNRLIAKFAIPRASRFWSSGFEATPRTALYPSNDRVEELCREVSGRVQAALSVGDMGQLLVEWAHLEEQLLPRARQISERNVSISEAIRVLVERGELSGEVGAALNNVRRVRNAAAHTPGRVEAPEIDRALRQLRDLMKRIPKHTT
jgi:hypothetical protein